MKLIVANIRIVVDVLVISPIVSQQWSIRENWSQALKNL